MFDLPAHDAHIVVKPFVRRAARTRQPRAYCGLFVKARRIRLDAKKRDEILVTLDARFARRLERAPQPRRKRRVVRELRIVFAQIRPHAIDKALRINFGERRNLFRRQLKHAGALSSVRR